MKGGDYTGQYYNTTILQYYNTTILQYYTVDHSAKIYILLIDT